MCMGIFKLHAPYAPAGDQPQAIAQLLDNFKRQQRYQTLLGVTGSGKTFTLANAIEKLDRPVLVLSHNKTLAAQLYSEFKAFFPENAVEYFISYYDYYLPESYIPQTDTYIAKDASINENIEKLRLSATASLVERRDVIVVASVSCIYGLGSPDDYAESSPFRVQAEYGPLPRYPGGFCGCGRPIHKPLPLRHKNGRCRRRCESSSRLRAPRRTF